MKDLRWEVLNVEFITAVPDNSQKTLTVAEIVRALENQGYSIQLAHNVRNYTNDSKTRLIVFAPDPELEENDKKSTK